MKTLFLLRHAKSSWKEIDFADFDRPLSKRGESDAPLMGKILHKKDCKPDIILSSPAKRAITTAKLLAEQLDYPKKDIRAIDEIYEAGTGELMDIIAEIDDHHKRAMLVGHNPAFTILANHLAPSHLEGIPTCGVVCIEFDVKSWSDVRAGKGRLLFFEYPKKYGSEE